jgi:hAT family C-terminal dimerisation region
MNVANQVQLPLSENILRSWEMRWFADPQLFGLSQVVLPVPPTQVSVERAFSALWLILTARRNRLGDNIVIYFYFPLKREVYRFASKIKKKILEIFNFLDVSDSRIKFYSLGCSRCKNFRRCFVVANVT